MNYGSSKVVRGGLIVVVTAVMTFASGAAFADNTERIQPYSENPYYWQYKGEPVLLLGGSWQDNLFNHPIGLEEHLELLVSVGGNYLRNVMSHRNEGNVFAYEQVDGQFDLDQWNDEYWRRFDDFLRMTYERDIIVQIEIWATWDHYEDHQTLGGWSKHPFNPANNINCTAEKSGLPTEADYPAMSVPTEHTFFSSVPALDNNELVLSYQKAYVDKLLSYSLNYPHVLYCMNNETGEDVEWSDFWARYVREQAAEAGKQVETAEMRRSHDITSPDHRHMINAPDLYTFLDISQNNTQSGQTHWDRMVYVRSLLDDHPRPINNNKIYSRGDDNEAVARMYRIILAGCASARFHRPHPLENVDAHEASTGIGLGLSPRAQETIRSARMLADVYDFFHAAPDADNSLLMDRDTNEAYLTYIPGQQYAVCFPNGGAVRLDLSDADGEFTLRWLNINESQWTEEAIVQGGAPVELTAPGEGHWAAVIVHTD